jgi:hypothetical protein
MSADHCQALWEAIQFNLSLEASAQCHELAVAASQRFWSSTEGFEYNVAEHGVSADSAQMYTWGFKHGGNRWASDGNTYAMASYWLFDAHERAGVVVHEELHHAGLAHDEGGANDVKFYSVDTDCSAR